MEVGAVPSLEEMADRLAIMEVLATHCRGVDRAHADTLKSCYWSDATVAYGGFNGNAHEFCAALPGSIKRFTATQHSITNVLPRIDGDQALVETYVTAYHYMEEQSEMTYIGRYIDRFAKREGVWKMAHRQVVMDWNQNVDATAVMNGPPFDGLARGARHPDDPLYQA